MNKKKLWTIIGILVLIIIWKLVSFVIGREIILPSPERTLKELLIIVGDKQFFSVAGTSLKRLLIAFTIDIILAVFLGTIAYIIKPIYFLLNPIVLTGKAIPTMAVVILALIWMGPEGAPLLVCSLVVFPILYSAVTVGYENIDSKLLEMNHIFRIPLLKKIRGLYIPSLLPYLKSGMTSAFGLNVKVLIAAEVLCQPELGIGSMFQIERAHLNTPGVFAWSAIVIVMTGLIDFILKKLLRQGVH